MQHSLCPGPPRFGHQFKRRAVDKSAAAGSRAVKTLAGGIEDQASQGGDPVVAVEVVQNRLRPTSSRSGGQFEHCAVAVSAAVRGRAVEISGRIQDQADIGIRPISPAAAEAMKYVLRPAPTRLGRKLERRADAVSAPLVGRAIQIASGVGDQAGEGPLSRPRSCR